LKKLLLPVRGMTCESCARSVESILKSKGIKDVKVDFSSGRALVYLEEPESLLSAIKELKSFGYSISYGEVVVRFQDIGQEELKKLVEDLLKVEGVIGVEVENISRRLFIKFSPLQVSEGKIIKLIKDSGFPYEIEGESSKGREISLFHRFLIGFVPTLLVLLGHHFHLKPFDNHILQGILASFVVLFVGYPIIKSGIGGFLKFSPNMNSLITLGSLSALISMNFEPASVIILLVLLGKSVEERMRERVYKELGSLIEGIPRFANVLRDGEVVKLYAEEISEGDVVVVKSGERIPVDGRVLRGEGEVSMAVLTGEFEGVKVSEGERVFAGSVLISGYLEVVAEKVGEDTFVGNLKKAVLSAQEEKGKIQTLADKISARFTWGVLIFAILTLIFWGFMGNFARGLYSAISVMVIACPCALGIATPLAIAVGISRAIKRGIVIKHPQALENAKDIKVVCFDKTGTLTEGKPYVVKFEGESWILPYISSLAEKSSHPYSKAIYKFVGSSPYKVENFREIVGLGIEGDVDGKRVKIEKGEGWIRGVVDGVEGKFFVEDEIKGSAFKVVESLKGMGLKVFIMSGDNEENTKRVAEKLKVEYFANLSPYGKVEKVRELREKFGKVAFVGDGINDAPVLSESDMGIAVGRATDLAILSGDIIIVRGDIELVPEIIKIARKTRSRILQNLLWAFLYNSLLIPTAMTGFIPPELSAFAMGMSSITVVLNSIR